MTMQWEMLLNSERPISSNGFYTSKDSPGRSDFERDFSRILYSNPFRRLQNKTQVFPMPENDHVHTRLTHSLEVADVGRSLGKLVGKEILSNNSNLSKIYSVWDFGFIVSAACLAHDIGNPPFGHSGEETVGNYFRSCAFKNKYAKLLTVEELSDLHNFEGNAQGFRILTRIGERYNYGGMRLTSSTLAAYCKYPQASYCIDKDCNDASRKKYNIYCSELDLFRSIANKVGLIKRNGFDSWCRHPLAFLTEAADDICYQILDLEDGCMLGFVEYERFEKLLQPIACLKSDELSSLARTREKVALLRARAIGNLISEASSIFCKYINDIMSGKQQTSLIKSSKYSDVIKEIEKASIRECYRYIDVVKIESAGDEVLQYLLDNMLQVIENPDHRLDSLVRHLLRDEVIYGIFLKEKAYQKMLMIVDMITGMTDRYAVTLYRQLKGITIRAV